jgi:hypothetical protein
MARTLIMRDRGLFVMRLLNNPAFWDRKIRIAVLTLATFAALC